MAMTTWEAIVARANGMDRVLRQGEKPDERDVRALVGEILDFQERISVSTRPVLDRPASSKP